MATTHEELIESIDGDFTPEQMHQLLSQLGDGDTDALSSEAGGQPAASTEKDSDASKAGDETDKGAADAQGSKKGDQQDADDLELTSDNAEIVAKDGKHRIPYDKLLEARESEKQWRTKAEANQRELDELRAQADARAEKGQPATGMDVLVAEAEQMIAEGADVDLFGDFSEAALVKGIKESTRAEIAPVIARLEKLEGAVAPIQQKQAVEVHDAHYGAIYTAHPDADSIAESMEFAAWRGKQASFMQPAIDHVFTNGAAKDVIELFDRFKAETGSAQPATDAQSLARTKAQEVINKAGVQVPASLSDFPGGRAAGLSKAEAMADMDGVQLLGAMDTMDAAQLEAYMNSI